MPSREVESSRGTESNQVGWSHHRWLATIAGNRITFLMKYHRIHAHWRLSFPASHLRTLSEERTVQWLFWEDWFDVEEQTIHGVDEIELELADYVRRVRPYNQVVVDIDQAARRLANQVRRVGRWASRQWPSGPRT
jgi:hypothetical protein